MMALMGTCSLGDLFESVPGGDKSRICILPNWRLEAPELQVWPPAEGRDDDICGGIRQAQGAQVGSGETEGGAGGSLRLMVAGPVLVSSVTCAESSPSLGGFLGHIAAAFCVAVNKLERLGGEGTQT